MISNNSTYNKYMYLKDIKTINSDEFTQKELETYLKKNGEILYIKKLTTSKTLVYLLLKNKRAAKIILHKKKKIPIAIIPWKIPLFVTTQKLSPYDIVADPGFSNAKLNPVKENITHPVKKRNLFGRLLKWKNEL